ncbi:MAG: putative membrane protein [uncultured Blastococcus sp.]|uniref:Putative membrane protein n=1 Tax=uncultured Blastococcus sp. TaxID=217144 RepID=A0A6J4IL67_9ACTN|nr:MAG: putative membrane protein [uncultured Blastococcus sp.]
MSSAAPGQPGPAPAREPWWTRAYARVEELVAAQRRRHRWFDHLARAGGRYQRTQGDLMAAGVTYFAFLGLFPVLLLVASIIGLVLAGNQLLQRQLFQAIRDAFPGTIGRELVRQVDSAIDGAGFIGVLALAGFLYAGLRTIDNLRIGMERIWKGHVDPPDVLRDNLQDLLALVALGAVGLASLGLTGGVTQATSWVLEVLGVADEPGYGVLTRVIGIGLAVAADVVVFLWLLRVVPSVSHPFRALLPGALFGAAGLEVLKLIGGYYLSLISDSVTASAFGGAVGLLVWINLVARFAFFTAAWTSTLRRIEAVPPVRADDVPAPA